MKVSVIVASYHPDMNAMRFTLGTLFEQDLDEFEVIISDDGSENNHYDEIIDFCREQHFSRVKFADHPENQGTVGNYLSALDLCDGDIIKPISPGDGLYCRSTLRDVWTFMTSHHIKTCFGHLRAYYKNERGEVIFTRYHHPYDMNAYRLMDTDKIAKNVILYSDNVSGAAMFYEREHFKELLERIQGQVKYVEDIVQAFDAAEGMPARLYDHSVVWYETGGGISTELNSPLRKRLKQDLVVFYKDVLPHYTDHPYAKKRSHLIKWYSRENYIQQILSIICVNPDILPFILRALVQYNDGVPQRADRSEGFLKDESFVRKYLDPLD